jgi:formylmethanofuran dehydrogenase subunit E
MRHLALFLAFALSAGMACADEAAPSLPVPDYDFEPNDPAWLKVAVQFHGHLGPWAAVGARLGMAGMKAVDAHGYFDIHVTIEGPFDQPPKSCMLDGVQVATGATWGKRNIEWVKAEKIVVRVRHTKNGKTAEVRPTAELLALATSFKPKPKVGADDHDHDGPHDVELEALARKIAKKPAGEILTVITTSAAK